MRVLLLGANGLLGHNVLHQLLLQGHEVVALARRYNAIALSAVPPNAKDNLCVKIGNILDYDFLLQSSSKCQAIINCAGVTNMSLLHYEDYLPVNRNLCQSLVRLVSQSDIDTLVHVSTTNTIGCGTPGCLANESFPPQPPFSNSYYAQSKMEGEEIVLRAAKTFATTQKRFVVVNPGFMVGAFDTKPSSGKLLMASYRLPIMFVPSGGKGFVAVCSAACAIVNALSMGVSGRRYLLVSENMSIADFYRLQAHVCGYRQILLPLPCWLMKTAGFLGDMLRCLHIKTQLSSVNVAQLMASEWYNALAAHTELAMPHISVEQAIADFFSWRKAHKNEC